jgi:hypothetical protein
MTEEQKKKEANRMQMQKAQVKASFPPWMRAEKVSFSEKLEIKLYQIISLFPVMVTFGLYLYLFIFYVVVILIHSPYFQLLVLPFPNDQWRLRYAAQHHESLDNSC